MRDAIFLLLLIAGGQGVFLAISLGVNFKKRFSGLLLGLLFLSFSLQLFDLVLLYSGKAEIYPHLTFWSTPFNLALGPLLYLYIRSSRSVPTLFRASSWLHFSPFLIHLIYIANQYHFHSAAYKISFIREILAIQNNLEGAAIDATNVIFALVIYGQLAIYLFLSNREVQTKQFGVEMIAWLKRLWYSILIIGLFGLLQFVLLALNIDQQPVTGYIAALLAVFYIYYGAMIVMKKPQVIFNPPKIEKYKYSSLTKLESENTLRELRAFMKNKRPFENPNLTLKELASDSGLSQKHISQVINEQLGHNFHDFVNEYRIKEFKAQLVNPSKAHLSLLGIAMECGFNSKSTFNTAFKRSTGITPSDYKKQVL